MLVDTESAVKKFFPNSSLEWVYFEAIANAIDSGASNVIVDVTISELSLPSTLEILIKDDGCGFTDKRFEKFKRLLKTENESRKGLGRLVYLNYFDSIEFDSLFGAKRRQFTFNKDFVGEKVDTPNATPLQTGTSVKFKQYNRTKIAKQQYLLPSHLANMARKHFYPAFLAAKSRGKTLSITFSLTHGIGASFADEEQLSTIITSNDFPETEEVVLDVPGFDSLFPFALKYSIEEKQDQSVLQTFAVVDDRTVDIDVVSKTKLPLGCSIVFLLVSDALQGKTDNSRLSLDITPAQMRAVKLAYLKGVRAVLEKKMPEIKHENERRIKDVEEKYPHLKGFFVKDEVGLLDNTKVLELAQKRFFFEQRSVFDSSDVTDEVFEKSLEQSSRLLTQYILYRLKIIQKLQQIKSADTEYTIHDLIVPRKSIYRSETLVEDVFANNAWVIDDKFMNYRTVLSDLELTKIYPEIGVLDGKEEDGRPDITVICSNTMDGEGLVDVVIVELKRLGVGEARNVDATVQLRDRARKLLEHHPGKIQRIWFYAIVDFDKDFKKYLRETKHVSLYSNGSVYYQEYDIFVDTENGEEEHKAQVFVMDYKALIEDAAARNSYFLELLKKGFADFQEPESGDIALEEEMEHPEDSDPFDDPPRLIPEAESEVVA